MHPWNENKIENMEKQRTYPLIISSSTWRAHIYPESNDMMRAPHRLALFLVTRFHLPFYYFVHFCNLVFSSVDFSGVLSSPAKCLCSFYVGDALSPDGEWKNFNNICITNNSTERITMQSEKESTNKRKVITIEHTSIHERRTPSLVCMIRIVKVVYFT